MEEFKSLSGSHIKQRREHTWGLRQLIYCAFFTALTAAGAFFKIPMPYFDYVTLQTLFVLLAGMLLGSRGGFLSQIVYVLLGLAGVPVFAGGGGPGYFLKPTFGYLIGFCLAAWLTGGLLAKRPEQERKFGHYYLAGLAGLAALYGLGILYRWFITNFIMEISLPFWALLLSCLSLEIPKDILICGLASWLARRLRQVVNI
jgi:biotin transport system substrate-specific component